MVSPLGKLNTFSPQAKFNALSFVFKHFTLTRHFTGIKGSVLKPTTPIILPINPNNRTTWDLLVNIRSKIKKNEVSKEDLESALKSALQKDDTITAKEIVMEQLRLKKGIPDIEIFNKILRGLALEKRWIEMDVLNTIIRHKKIPLTADTYRLMFYSHRMRNNVAAMYQLLEVMKQKKLEPTSEIYVEFVEEFFQRSLKIVRKKTKRDLNSMIQPLITAKFPFSLQLLELTIRTCYMLSDIPLIGKLWNIAKEKNYIPSVDTYNYRLLAAVHTKQFQLVQRIFQDMKKQGVSPSTQTYEILLKSRSITKLKEDVQTYVDSILNEMKERKVPIDTSIYDAVIQCYARRCYFNKASETITFMHQNNIPFSNQTPCSILPSIRRQFVLDELLGRKTAELLRRVRHLRDKKGTRYQPVLNPVDVKALLHIVEILPKYKQASVPKKRPNPVSAESPKEK